MLQSPDEVGRGQRNFAPLTLLSSTQSKSKYQQNIIQLNYDKCKHFISLYPNIFVTINNNNKHNSFWLQKSSCMPQTFFLNQVILQYTVVYHKTDDHRLFTFMQKRTSILQILSMFSLTQNTTAVWHAGPY